MAKQKLKAAAQTAVPQTQDEAASDIKRIGDLKREKTRIETRLNDEVAKLTEALQPSITAIDEQLKTLQQGVQTYCEAHRAELTKDGKTKSAHFLTGEVMWRQKPPSVRVKALDNVLAALKNFKLNRFIRVKEEINKDAVLEEPEAVAGVAGLSIVSGKEQFEITPFEQEA